MRYYSLEVFFVSLVFVTVNAVSAATPPATGERASDDTIEQVIVTARRQQEALIDAPVTVTALSSRRLEELGISDFKDISDFTPGIIINGGVSANGRMGAQIIIRGMTPSLSALASVFIDGVPVAAGVVEGVVDAARVEVLRGPQTAYFGRSTFAGAINFVSKTPDMSAFRGRVEGVVGDNALLEGRAQFEGPLIEDKLSFRIAGRYYEKDGTYENVADGSRFGNEQTRLLSAALRFAPNDRFSMGLYAYLQQDNDGPTTIGKDSVPQYNCNAGANPGGPFNYICGTAPNVSSIPLGQNFSTFGQFTQAVLNSATPNPTPANAFITPIFRDQFLKEPGYERQVDHVHLTAELAAGPLTFSSLAGYNKSDAMQILDLDLEDSRAFPNTAVIVNPAFAPPFSNQLFRNEQFFEDYFVELRARTSDEKALRFSLGASYAYSETGNLVSTLQNNGVPTTFGLGAVTEAKTPAVFGSVSLDFLTRWTLDIEGRYQTDKVATYRRSAYKDFSGTVNTVVNGMATTIPTFIAGAEFKEFTPRVILQFRPMDGLMAYASYAEGTNPGTFNTSVLAFDAAFQARLAAATGVGVTVNPESIENIELGIKTQFWDGRAQVTAAVYSAEWIDQIVPQTFFDTVTGNSAAVNTNVGRTKLEGVEAEFAVRPLPQFEINGTLAYNGSDIREYVCVACRAFAGAGVSVIGNSLYRAPRTTGSLGAQYTAVLSDSLSAYGRADYFYKGSLYADETNIAQSEPQQQVNFRFGVVREALRVEAFVTNAFNDRGPNSFVRGNDPLRGGQIYFQLGVPELRRIGMRVSYEFEP